MNKKGKDSYVKENNLLQLALFNFSRYNIKKTEIEWLDENDNECKLVCNCDYGVPGSFEMDVYTATMRLWVRQGMPQDGLEVFYIEIARELQLFPEKSWIAHIKKSLKKLGMARYEFEKCFIEAESEERVTTHFSLYSETKLWDRKSNNWSIKKSKLYFPEQIRKNLEAKYYQFLDMEVYRSLPSGLPRRLYEYLVKRKRHRIKNVFTISETAICRWLPIHDKNASKRRQRLEKSADELIKINFLEAYEFDKKRRLCLFTYSNSKPIFNNNFQKYEETAKAQENPLFQEFTDWLSSLKGFNEQRKQEILKLDQKETLTAYPEIRERFEQASSQLSLGWLYKALKERWTFTEKKEKQAELTREQREAKELFESWPKQKQEAFVEELKVFMRKNLLKTECSDEDIQKIVNSGGVYGMWGQILMKDFG